LGIKKVENILIFAAFTVLIGLTIAHKPSWAKLRTKSREDWILDGLGLLVQGLLIPILQIAVIYQLYRYFLPLPQGCLHLPQVATFLLSFILVDYLYYWNHRCLHSRWFWHLHQVHHTVTDMDVLGTSRNSLWTSFLIIYLWIHALFLYLLHDSTGYLIGVSITAALDLWRHSQLAIAPQSWLFRLLSPWLILPQDHAWHHASDSGCRNYGANLKIWDKLHGTYYYCKEPPASLGIPTTLTLTQKLLYPLT
jgi:sterol desaturase/sphingolipid hydroxylase (fatty acid hydroxylase superfamily)